MRGLFPLLGLDRTQGSDLPILFHSIPFHPSPGSVELPQGLSSVLPCGFSPARLDSVLADYSHNCSDCSGSLKKPAPAIWTALIPFWRGLGGLLRKMGQISEDN